MVGALSTNALVALIFQKQTKVSAATNKTFSNGEIINFIQVDASKM